VVAARSRSAFPLNLLFNIRRTCFPPFSKWTVTHATYHVSLHIKVTRHFYAFLQDVVNFPFSPENDPAALASCGENLLPCTPPQDPHPLETAISFFSSSFACTPRSRAPSLRDFSTTGSTARAFNAVLRDLKAVFMVFFFLFSCLLVPPWKKPLAATKSFRNYSPWEGQKEVLPPPSPMELTSCNKAILPLQRFPSVPA